MNDRPPFEVETAYADREGDGWTQGRSGNSTTAFLPTADGEYTFVAWDEAPDGMVAARFQCFGAQQLAMVKDGCVLAVFDTVQADDPYADVPQLAAWIGADGVEHPVSTTPVSVLARTRGPLDRGPDGRAE